MDAFVHSCVRVCLWVRYAASIAAQTPRQARTFFLQAMLLFRLWVPASGKAVAPSRRRLYRALRSWASVFPPARLISQVQRRNPLSIIQLAKLKGQPSDAYNAVVGRLGQHQPWCGCLKSSHPNFPNPSFAIPGRSCPTSRQAMEATTCRLTQTFNMEARPIHVPGTSKTDVVLDCHRRRREHCAPLHPDSA